jgi:hypothetical protein
MLLSSAAPQGEASAAIKAYYVSVHTEEPKSHCSPC